MKIAIVDDDSAFRESFASLVKSNSLALPVSVTSFANGNALLLSPSTSFDAFFLDIYLENEDGMALAKRLDKTLVDPLLVFVTSSETRAVEAFSLPALHYLVKPLSQASVDEALARINGELEKKAKKIVFETKDGFLGVPLSDLLYIESFGNDKFFKLKDKSFSLRRSSADMLSLLGSDVRFYPLSRSYIVNFEYVEGLQGDFLLLRNGERLPIPHQRKKAVAEAFLNFLHS